MKRLFPTLNCSRPAQPEENPFGCPKPLQELRSKETPPTPGLKFLFQSTVLFVYRAIAAVSDGAQVMPRGLQRQETRWHVLHGAQNVCGARVAVTVIVPFFSQTNKHSSFIHVHKYFFFQSMLFLCFFLNCFSVTPPSLHLEREYI